MLGVKPETYYAWIRRPPSKRSQDNTEMLKKIKAIHKESKELYGSPKIYQMLKAQNVDCSENRVAKLMRKNSIKAKIRKKFRAKSKVIKSSHASENLLKREFQVLRINTVWVTDITYIPTRLGWMYLCVFIDLFSRKIVGWSMANHMRTEMVIAALIMAYQNRKPGKGAGKSLFGDYQALIKKFLAGRAEEAKEKIRELVGFVRLEQSYIKMALSSVNLKGPVLDRIPKLH